MVTMDYNLKSPGTYSLTIDLLVYFVFDVD